MTNFETATLGGGCFWCLEAAYQEIPGVQRVISGYAGGHVPNPTYEEVCEKTTGHAEVVQVTWDPTRLTYDDVLDLFFRIHDPTTLNRQGNDVGPQYRSVVFTHDAAQQATAERVVRELAESRAFPAPIVTEILPVPVFYPADEHHQNYFRKHPAQAYCAVVVRAKVEKAREWRSQL